MFAGEGAVVLGVAFVRVWRPLLVRGLGETVIAMEDAWDGMDGWVGLDWIGLLGSSVWLWVGWSTVGLMVLIGEYLG